MGGDGADWLYGGRDRGQADTIDCGGDDGERDVVRAHRNDIVVNCNATDRVRQPGSNGQAKAKARGKRR